MLHYNGLKLSETELCGACRRTEIQHKPGRLGDPGPALQPDTGLCYDPSVGPDCRAWRNSSAEPLMTWSNVHCGTAITASLALGLCARPLAYMAWSSPLCRPSAEHPRKKVTRRGSVGLPNPDRDYPWVTGRRESGWVRYRNRACSIRQRKDYRTFSPPETGSASFAMIAILSSPGWRCNAHATEQ